MCDNHINYNDELYSKICSYKTLNSYWEKKPHNLPTKLCASTSQPLGNETAYCRLPSGYRLYTTSITWEPVSYAHASESYLTNMVYKGFSHSFTTYCRHAGLSLWHCNNISACTAMVTCLFTSTRWWSTTRATQATIACIMRSSLNRSLNVRLTIYKKPNKVLELLHQATVTVKLPKYHFFQEKIDSRGKILMPDCSAAAYNSIGGIKTDVFPDRQHENNILFVCI